MSTTVYTYNDKVLVNSANDKWLKKPEPPAGFVMNAANATYTYNGGYWVSWQSPAYPDGYNGDGKQYILVNNNATVAAVNPLMYSTEPNASGPTAITVNGMTVLGESTGTLLNNIAGGSYGSYLCWPVPIGATATLEETQAYMANVSITILDP